MRVRVPYHETGTIVTQLQEETALRLFCQMTARTRLKRKEVDDVLGGDDMTTAIVERVHKLDIACVFKDTWATDVEDAPENSVCVWRLHE